MDVSMKEISYLILVSLFFISLGASAKELGYTFTADYYKSDVLCRIAACEAAQNSARISCESSFGRLGCEPVGCSLKSQTQNAPGDWTCEWTFVYRGEN